MNYLLKALTAYVTSVDFFFARYTFANDPFPV